MSLRSTDVILGYPWLFNKNSSLSIDWVNHSISFSLNKSQPFFQCVKPSFVSTVSSTYSFDFSYSDREIQEIDSVNNENKVIEYGKDWCGARIVYKYSDTCLYNIFWTHTCSLPCKHARSPLGIHANKTLVIMR